MFFPKSKLAPLSSIAWISSFKSIPQAGQTSCFEDIIPVSVGAEFIASPLDLELKATTSSCWKEISTASSKCSCMCFVCCIVVCFAPAAMHIQSLEVTRFCCVVGILAKVVLLHSIPQCWHFLSLISMRGGRSSSTLHIMNTSILSYLLRELTPPSRPPTIIHAMFQLPRYQMYTTFGLDLSCEHRMSIGHPLAALRGPEYHNLFVKLLGKYLLVSFHQCCVSIRLGSLSRSVSFSACTTYNA